MSAKLAGLLFAKIKSMKMLLVSAIITLILVPQTVYSLYNCHTLFAEVPYTISKPDHKRSTDLYIEEKTDTVEEYSIRKGPTAAHVYLDSGKTTDPYFFIGFPAGNSGVAIWAKPSKNETIHFKATAQTRALRRAGGLNGIETPIRSGVKTLSLEDSVLGSMRTVRDRELGLEVPKLLQTRNVRIEGRKLIYQRDSINGLAKYVMEIEPLNGTRIEHTGDRFSLVSDSEVRFILRGFTSEKPLTPIPLEDLFEQADIDRMDPKRLRAFSFLLYKEKILAGSPRYFSRFGRDSAYTLYAFLNILKPEAMDDLISAGLSGANPKTGEISHEQHDGDFASYVRMQENEKYSGVNKSIEDYKMIDDDFAYSILIAKHLNRKIAREKQFLDRKEQRGIEHRTLINKLFNFVEAQAVPFSKNPIFSNLIGLRHGEKTGQWRDSENGLGGGRYPFDVNAAFVPGALKALAELCANSKSEFYDSRRAAELNRMFNVWNKNVIGMFEVRIKQNELAAYSATYSSPPPPKEDLVFSAISLDAEGHPIPIMHSDDSLMMTFGYPSESHLKSVGQRVRLPFPYGLQIPVGILVSNAVFAPPALQKLFDETKYHGKVVWTMQEDFMIIGLLRQLQREDLSPKTRAELSQNFYLIESLIKSRGDLGGIEVFSFDGERPVSFAGDAKSNSNQLWSHLRLTIFP